MDSSSEKQAAVLAGAHASPGFLLHLQGGLAGAEEGKRAIQTSLGFEELVAMMMSVDKVSCM